MEGMKREHTDDDRYGSSRNSKRQRADGFSEALAQGKFELRILVSSKCAGAIIGKGGENIKRLRTQPITLTIIGLLGYCSMSPSPVVFKCETYVNLVPKLPFFRGSDGRIYSFRN
ncbi:hypothetical protein Y032_0053g2296 [Ancylostoma ceylanicum]|nr:hypothetical protein Y032_0053g2296 [Ancylostoma ceylanicum]